MKRAQKVALGILLPALVLGGQILGGIAATSGTSPTVALMQRSDATVTTAPRDDRDAGSGDGPGGRGELSGGEDELRGSERGERRELGSGCSDRDDDRSGHCPQRDGDD